MKRRTEKKREGRRGRLRRWLHVYFAGKHDRWSDHAVLFHAMEYASAHPYAPWHFSEVAP